MGIDDQLEVQRTLVKSPPELWTELSDPESLARHLGELGEITITRTEPENLVEWEAEGTTGTVEIAPSGWGTRVTLTVLREPADRQAPPAEPEAEGDAPAETEEPFEPQAGTIDAEDAQPEATAPPAAGEHAEDAIAIDPTAEVEIQDPAAPGAERKPAPATEAARRAAGWPGARHAPGPAIESDLRAAEALDGPPPEPDGLHDWAAQSAEAEMRSSARTTPRKTRRRWSPSRRNGAVRAPLRTPARTGEEAGAGGRGRCGRGAARRDADRRTGDPELPADEGPAGWDELAAADEASADPPPTRPSSGVPTSRPSASPRPTWTTSSPWPRSRTRRPVAGPSWSRPPRRPTERAARQRRAGLEISQAEPEALEQAETAAAEPEQTDEDCPATPAPDLAAELRAAEEVASEQVEAGLTAVLDRLGSAHHRPFSRP